MIKLIKNFISQEKADTIEKDLLGDYFDWYWNASTLGITERDNFKTKNTVEEGQFVHRLLDTPTNTKSSLYEGFTKVFDIINYEYHLQNICIINLNIFLRLCAVRDQIQRQSGIVYIVKWP